MNGTVAVAPSRLGTQLPYFPSDARSGSRGLRNKERIKAPWGTRAFFRAQSSDRTHRTPYLFHLSSSQSTTGDLPLAEVRVEQGICTASAVGSEGLYSQKWTLHTDELMATHPAPHSSIQSDQCSKPQSWR